MNSRVRVVHVGNMANKGTQALLGSTVSLIKEILGSDAFCSISTTGYYWPTTRAVFERLGLLSCKILPPVIDIPYEKTDSLCNRFGFERGSFRYKTLALGYFIYMFIQIALSIVSVFLIKINLPTFYRGDSIEQFKQCDLVVSYSDENFRESPSYLPPNLYWVVSWWTMLISRTWEIVIAKSFGKPVVMFPNSIGPFQTCVGRLLSRYALNRCDYVFVREPISYSTAQSLGIKKLPTLTSDTALLFRVDNNVTAEHIEGPVVGVCAGVYNYTLSDEQLRHYVSVQARALDIGIKKYGYEVVFLPHGITGFRYDDLEISRMILGEMKNKKEARIMEIDDVNEFKLVLSQMSMIISLKMHPSVLGVSCCIPVLCLAYDQKQLGFFRSLGLENFVIDLREISLEALWSKMAQLWEERSNVKNLLEERVPVLQKQTRMAIKRTLTLLRENEPALKKNYN
jgi:polysaccharide pyruvyl transferase WcaK-like protein